MLNVRSSALALAGLLVVPVAPISSRAATFQQDFSSDPTAQDWKAVGDTNLFHWNSAKQNLDITWDSSRPNSYCCRPLGTIVGQEDDFSVAFDLVLSDFAGGVNPQKPNPFQLSLGFLNLSEAIGTNFVRGTGANTPDLVEFSFFPDPGGAWQWGPSITTTFIDWTGTNWWTTAMGGFAGLSLTTGDVFHVTLTYTASDKTLRTTITRNGESFGPVSDAKLQAGFPGFRLDHFAVCSYSDAGQDPAYAGSLLAHGTIDNLVVTVPDPPVTQVTGGINSGTWQVQFASRTNWSYVLERSIDLSNWTPASAALSGTGVNLVLSETNALADRVFYRVSALKP